MLVLEFVPTCYSAKFTKILENKIRGNSLGKLTAKTENIVHVIPKIRIGNF